MMCIISSFQTNQSSLAFQKEKSSRILECFDMVYTILYAILRHRREEMIHLIPLFFAYISALVECFTSSDGLAHNPNEGHNKIFSGKVSMRPMAFCCPVPCSSSKQITRLFLQMTVKSIHSTTNPKFHSIKPFSKYVPFLLTRLVSLPITTRWNISTQEWKEWCFVCLDLCDDHGRDMVLASLSLTGSRVVYKNLVGDWEKNHRYKGSR